jgi:hypothetical protein
MASIRRFPLSQLVFKFRAAALATVMVGAATLASAAPPAAPGNGSFLALGDSLAFGVIAADGFAYVNPNNFIGYPDYVGGDLRLDTANAAPARDAGTSGPAFRSTSAIPPLSSISRRTSLRRISRPGW